MKLRNLIEFAGFRQSPQWFGFNVDTFAGENGSQIKFANWNHPRVHQISQSDVDNFPAYDAVINPGDFCIDIGAHTGDTTLPIAIAAGKEGLVLAVEPNYHLFHVLQKNARLNRSIANIEPILAASASEPGEISLEYSDSGFCNGGRHEGLSPLQHGHMYKMTAWGLNLAEEIESDYSDRLNRLSFIKVDAEGYDLYILQSLTSLFGKARPIVKAEIFKKTDQAYRESMFDFFNDKNYQVFRITEEPVGKPEPITRDEMNSFPHFDILATPR